MLPVEHRLSTQAQFKTVMKKGRRVKSRNLMIHFLSATATLPGENSGSSVELSTPRAPRCGLVISKAVGNSVVRHNTARKLRAAFFNLVKAEHPALGIDATEQPRGYIDIVVRAFPGAASLTTVELQRELELALDKAFDKSFGAKTHTSTRQARQGVGR